MPPQSLEKNKPTRRICPWCSKEVANPYLSLHKKLYCPMRPSRQEEIKAEAMGFDKKKSGEASSKMESSTMAPTPTATEVSPDTDNIKEIELSEEYRNMVKIMKEKEKEVDIGEEYQCGSCNETWYAKSSPKRCPSCGVEFQ